MNWYKIFSQNIKLDTYLSDLASEISSEMAKLYGQSFGNIVLGTDIFVNKYTGKQQNISIVALDKPSNMVGKYSPKYRVLNVYPIHFKPPYEIKGLYKSILDRLSIMN